MVGGGGAWQSNSICLPNAAGVNRAVKLFLQMLYLTDPHRHEEKPNFSVPRGIIGTLIGQFSLLAMDPFRWRGSKQTNMEDTHLSMDVRLGFITNPRECSEVTLCFGPV